jgi:hypothetical protein
MHGDPSRFGLAIEIGTFRSPCRRKLMKGMVRMAALGAILAASAATAAMAQGVNNTGYSREYYGLNNPYGNSTWYDRQNYGGHAYAPGAYAPRPNYGPGGGDSYGSSGPYGSTPGWWNNGGSTGPARQAPWGYGGEYGHNAGFRSPDKY